MQAQQSLVIPERRLSTSIAVVATVVAAALAFALVVNIDRASTIVPPAVVALHNITSQQVAHDRDEQGLGGAVSPGGQQIAHNRSEEGFGGS